MNFITWLVDASHEVHWLLRTYRNRFGFKWENGYKFMREAKAQYIKFYLDRNCSWCFINHLTSYMTKDPMLNTQCKIRVMEKTKDFQRRFFLTVEKANKGLLQVHYEYTGRMRHADETEARTTISSWSCQVYGRTINYQEEPNYMLTTDSKWRSI